MDAAPTGTRKQEPLSFTILQTLMVVLRFDQKPVSDFTTKTSGDKETIMELKELDAEHVRFVVSLDDLGAMGNALNQVCN
jgi:hypothetical protein